MPAAIHTLGHSTRPIEDFLSLLTGHRIDLLGDIRTVPRSRHNPQFDQAALRETLERAGIEYRHLPGLGGLRKPKPDSINMAWRHPSFRGYADYMQTPEFAGHVERLVGLAGERRVAVMCAEAVPWRCHRSLLADALIIRGVEVLEIASTSRVTPQTLTAWARVDGTRVSYPGVVP